MFAIVICLVLFMCTLTICSSVLCVLMVVVVVCPFQPSSSLIQVLRV